MTFYHLRHISSDMMFACLVLDCAVRCNSRVADIWQIVGVAARYVSTKASSSVTGVQYKYSIVLTHRHTTHTTLFLRIASVAPGSVHMDNFSVTVIIVVISSYLSAQIRVSGDSSRYINLGVVVVVVVAL